MAHPKTNLRFADIIDKKSKLMDSMLKLHNQSGVKTIHANQHNEINFIDKGKLIRELNKKQEITETDK